MTPPRARARRSARPAGRLLRERKVFYIAERCPGSGINAVYEWPPESLAPLADDKENRRRLGASVESCAEASLVGSEHEGLPALKKRAGLKLASENGDRKIDRDHEVSGIHLYLEVGTVGKIRLAGHAQLALLGPPVLESEARRDCSDGVREVVVDLV